MVSVLGIEVPVALLWSNHESFGDAVADEIAEPWQSIVYMVRSYVSQVSQNNG